MKKRLISLLLSACLISTSVFCTNAFGDDFVENISEVFEVFDEPPEEPEVLPVISVDSFYDETIRQLAISEASVRYSGLGLVTDCFVMYGEGLYGEATTISLPSVNAGSIGAEILLFDDYSGYWNSIYPDVIDENEISFTTYSYGKIAVVRLFNDVYELFEYATSNGYEAPGLDEYVKAENEPSLDEVNEDEEVIFDYVDGVFDLNQQEFYENAALEDILGDRAVLDDKGELSEASLEVNKLMAAPLNVASLMSLADEGHEYQFGDNVYGDYDSSTKTVTIVGTGPMYDNYGIYSSPIWPISSEVEHAVIGSGVTSIAPYLFYQFHNLTDVSVPATVTSVGEHAFYECYSITTLGDISSVRNVGDFAFYECNSITDSINLTLDSIGVFAFLKAKYDWDDIPEVAYSPMSITFSPSVTEIPERAFAGCIGLSSIVLSESVTAIGIYAFSGCTGLISVSMTDNLTVIGDYAFANCKSLPEITLHSTITKIGDSALAFCNKLEKIYCNGFTLTEDGPFGFLETYYFSDGTSIRKFEAGTTYNTVLYRTRPSFTVTFVTNGGTSLDPITVSAGGKVPSTITASKTGYYFSGWYTNPGLTEKWDPTTDVVVSNMTLYAKYVEPTSYIISVPAVCELSQIEGNSYGGTVDIGVSLKPLNNSSNVKLSAYTSRQLIRENEDYMTAKDVFVLNVGLDQSTFTSKNCTYDPTTDSYKNTAHLGITTTIDKAGTFNGAVTINFEAKDW